MIMSYIIQNHLVLLWSEYIPIHEVKCMNAKLMFYIIATSMIVKVQCRNTEPPCIKLLQATMCAATSTQPMHSASILV